MNTKEIYSALSHLEDFLGVFSSNQIPFVDKKPSAFVINTDPSDKPGKHWVAVYHKSNGEAEYFDSFGLPPLTPDILKHLEDNAFHWHYNPTILQHYSSNTCGKYCILFLLLRSRGYSFCSIVNFFTKQLRSNDKLVHSLKLWH